MSEQNRAFLAGLAALPPSAAGNRLEADAVNRLGAALGLDGPGILAAVEAMNAEGLIDLHWGAALSLTDKGRRCAAGGTAANGGVTAYAGSTVVMGDVGARANVGTGAGAKHSKVAVGSTVNGVPAGLLAAALTLLREDKASLPTAAQAPAEDLEKELEATAAAVSNADAKDEATSSTALVRVGEGLRRSTELLGHVEQAGGKLTNVGGMLKKAWDAVEPHLPNF